MFDRTLESYVPRYYDGIPQIESIMYAEQQIIDDMFSIINLIKNNNYVVTADNDTLTYYEKILGLSTPDSTGLTDEEFRRLRIQQIQAKLANQFPITYRFLVQNLETYYGEYGIDFTIKKDFDNYNFVINTTTGVPETNRRVDKYLIQTIPANMLYNVISGNTHNELHDNNQTHNDLHSYTHNYLNNGGKVE